MQRRQTAGRQRVRRRITRCLMPDLFRLENRQLLSTFDVASTADDGSTGTLSWASSPPWPVVLTTLPVPRPRVSFTIGRAATQAVMVPLLRFKTKKLVSLGLEANVQPISPGSGVPTGTVTFEVQVKSKKKADEKVLGIATLRGGSATLTLKPSKVLNKPAMIVFGGDADFASSAGPTTTLTQKGLSKQARPIQL